MVDKEHPADSTELSRRAMLKAFGGVAAGMAIAPAGAVWVGKAKVSGHERIGLADPLYYSSATAIARAIKKKHISSEEVTSTFLERIRHVNPKIHAVVQLRGEAALDLAREADRKLSKGEYLGPLHGVPITIKDSLDTIGLVSTAGTKGRASFIPKRDASVVGRLKASGAIVMGKTNTPELTLHGYTENLLYQRTNNPYSIHHSPMGSSGGAAAIVAAGGSAFDIGSDTGGSVRIPSHACGVCGLKPTAGRVSRTGHILSYDTFNQALTTLGPIARCVEDLVTILPIISGSDGIDPFAFDIPIGDYRDTNIADLSFAFYTDNGVAAPTASVDKAVRRVASRIETAGAAVEENRPPETARVLELFWKITGADGGYGINRILKENGTKEVSPYMAWAQGNAEQYETASISPKQFGELFTKWHSTKSNMTRFFTDYDVLLCPASAIPAPTHDVAMQELEATMLSYTAIYNITGWPAAVVRIGTSADGLPIGIQIVGKPWQEAVVLAVAKFVEQEFTGFIPPAI